MINQDLVRRSGLLWPPGAAPLAFAVPVLAALIAVWQWFAPSTLQLILWAGLLLTVTLLIPLLWRGGYIWMILWVAPIEMIDPLPLSAVRIGKYAVVALILAVALIKRSLVPPTASSWDRRVLIPGAIFLVWIWIRALTGGAPVSGSFEALRLTAVGGLIYLFLSESPRAGGRRRWYVLWLVLALIQVGLCMTQVWLWHVSRSTGTYTNANKMGAFFMLTVALVFAAAHWAPRRRVRGWAWAACVPLFLGLYLTGSRASWLASAVAILVILLLARNWRVLVLGLVLILNVAYLYAYNPVTRQVIDTAVRLERGLSFRPLLWQAALHAWSRSPWVGFGVEAAGEQMAREARYPSPAHRKLIGVLMRSGRAHNFYLTMLVETGLIGLLLIVPVIIAILKTAWRARLSEDRWRATFAFATLAMTFAIISHSFFERSVFIDSVSRSVYYWLMLALTMRGDDPSIPAEEA